MVFDLYLMLFIPMYEFALYLVVVPPSTLEFPAKPPPEQ